MKIAAALILSVSSLVYVPSAQADVFGSGANTFNINFVAVHNPGNPSDATVLGPLGSVPYAFRMGKFEISEEMITKANALGGLGLTKDTRGSNKPATSVSWNEAARFVNWLNTSEGFSPAYKFAIQPGNSGYSANDGNLLWSPGDPGFNPSNPYRSSLARYALPSANEWHKAAYYDPTGGVYYDYPTGSDSVPDGLDFAGDPNFDAVFSDSTPIPSPNDVTNVGLLSPYGTAGQGGNVYEWEETDYDLLNGPTLSSSPRGVRGGIWLFDDDNLLSSRRNNFTPPSELPAVGFRVVSVPEPNTLLLAMTSVGLLLRRKRVAQSTAQAASSAA